MNHSPFPIFVINLKRSPERRTSISKQLDALGLECQYIEAVDGMQFTPHQVVEKYGEQVFYTNTYNRQRMTLGSLGCLLSHIKFYEMMIENNIPAACVLEDDAELSPSFSEILSSKILQEVPWGTLLLGHYSMYRKSFNKGAEAVYWKKKICPGYHIARAAEFPFTTLGYLVKLPTAKKLRELAYPIRMPADWVTGNTELIGNTLRVITPPCVVTNKEYRRKSTVRDNTDAAVPIELQRETPTLSLKRDLVVNFANRILGSKEQRAQAAFYRDKMPSTYSPKEWQLTQDDKTERREMPNIVKRKNAFSFESYSHLESKTKRKVRKATRYWMKRQSRRRHMLLNVIKGRAKEQKVLWRRIGRASSIKGLLYLGLRFVLNIPITFLLVLVYFIQDINRSVYYGRVFSAIRIYIKKLGLFKYTRVV